MNYNIPSINHSELYPLMGEQKSADDFVPVRVQDNDQYDMQTNEGLHACVQDQIKAKGGRWGYGGYLEYRNIYRRSSHFDGSNEEERSIHLGVDIWGPEGMTVFAPLDAKLHSFQYNAAPFDYGATIILEHQCEGKSFYTLYGHLSRKDLVGIHKGMSIRKGAPFCQFGGPADNGGWVPHLHFQLILDIGQYEGDYPGVVKPSEKEVYAENCPDPNLLWRKPKNGQSTR